MLLIGKGLNAADQPIADCWADANFHMCYSIEGVWVDKKTKVTMTTSSKYFKGAAH